MYSWYQNIFHVIAVLIVFHAANGENRKKIILKQDNKSRKGDQNVVVVANPPGSSSLRCRTAIAPLSHRYRYAVAPPLSLCCCAAAAPLSHRYRSTVDPLLSLLMSLRSRTAMASRSRHCRSANVAPAVATQSHRYRTVVAPLSNRDNSGPERV